MAKKKNIYLCVDVKTHTEKSIMHVGDSRQGVLSMQSDFLFDFVEESAIHWKRNPKVWCGKYINVHKNRKGEYVMNFKRLVLSTTLDPSNFADDVFLDVERVKTELGL